MKLPAKLIGMCLYSGLHGIECNGDLIKCHLRKDMHIKGAGMGIKPREAEFPMCHAHHSHQHQIGEVSFHGDGILLVKRLCRDLAMESNLIKARGKILECRNALRREE